MAIEAYADGVPASARDVLVELYRQAAGRVQDAVLHPTGRTFRARRFTRARAAELIAQIDRVQAELKARTIAWVSDNAEKAYAAGQVSAVRQLEAAGLRRADLPVTGSLSQVDRRTVAVIAADMAIDLEAAAGRQAASAQRFLRAAGQRIVPDSALSEVIAAGAITGDVRGTVRQMRGLLNLREIEDYRKAGQQLIEVGRATMSVRAYAEMLVTTRTREASVQGRHERLVANGRDLVSIVGRVSQNFCTEYLGRVFSITGASDRYPALAALPAGGPPFHPNCSKSTRAYIEEFASDEQRRQAVLPDRAMLTTDRNAAQRRFGAKGGAAVAARRWGRRVA